MSVKIPVTSLQLSKIGRLSCQMSGLFLYIFFYYVFIFLFFLLLLFLLLLLLLLLFIRSFTIHFLEVL